MITPAADPVRDDRAAIDKAISLLIAFGDQASTGVGVSELARRTQLSKSTAFRVLGMLERNGVVERAGTGYRLGARLHQLGQAVYSCKHELVRDLLLPYLADLYEMTRHTVHLAALHDTDVVYLAKLYGRRTIPAPSRIGGRLPAHATAVGKLLLAYDSYAAARVLTAHRRALTPHTLTDPDQLAEEFATIRKSGIALDHQESRLGLACVAAPVFNSRGQAVAALSVAGPHGGFASHRWEAALRRVCAAASQAVAKVQLPRPA